MAKNPKRVPIDQVITLMPPAPEVVAREKPKSRPHMSLYLPTAAMREIKMLAIQEGCRPHDILVEAIELVLAKYGRPGLADMAKDE